MDESVSANSRHPEKKKETHRACFIEKMFAAFSLVIGEVERTEINNQSGNFKIKELLAWDRT